MESVKGHTAYPGRVKLLLFPQHAAETSPAVIPTTHTPVLCEAPQHGGSSKHTGSNTMREEAKTFSACFFAGHRNSQQLNIM